MIQRGPAMRVAGVGVVAGGVQVAGDFRVLHALPELRNRTQGLQQELAVVGPALLQVIRPADGTHARDAVAQRDQPDPAVLEAIDADVAGVGARAPLHAPEVRKQRRTLVAPALALDAQLVADQRVAARRVDEIAGPAAKGLPRLRRAGDGDAVRARTRATSRVGPASACTPFAAALSNSSASNSSRRTWKACEQLGSSARSKRKTL